MNPLKIKTLIKLKTRTLIATIIGFALTAHIAAAFVLPVTPNTNITNLTLQASSINTGGFYSTDRVRRGGTVQAAIVMEIPEGLHVNSNRPLGKYAVPTVVKVEAADGLRVTPVVYPRSTVRKFGFSDERLAVYEGRAVMRFNVSVPANYGSGRALVRARLRFQSCNNEACFPPATREIELPIDVVNTNEQVRPTNTGLFSNGRRRR